MMRINLLLFISAVSLLASCAQRGAPTGGPKDETPPQLLNTVPIHESTSFNGKEIILYFDEYIEMNNLQRELIISPNLEQKYEPKISKNKLTIEFEKSLPENTTFTFNFNEGVKDVTEGNTAKDLFLAFSTGPSLDTLKVNGKVTELYSQEPVKEAVIGLYQTDDTLDLFNAQPLYFAKSNENGEFELKYLKEGQYNLYAFSDKNTNLQADSRNEGYGFYPQPIELSQGADTLEYNFNIQRLNIDSLKLLNARPSASYFDIRFNKHVIDYALDPISKDVEIISNRLGNDPVIRVYQTPALLAYDSTAAFLHATDSADQQLADTVYIKFYVERDEQEDFTSAFTPSSNTAINEKFEGKFTFSKPVTTVNVDSIFFQYDSTTIVTFNPEADFEWNKRRDELIIRKKLDRSKVYKGAIQEKVKGKPEQSDTLKQEIKNTTEIKELEENETSRNKIDEPSIKKEIYKVLPTSAYVDKIRLFIHPATFQSIEGDSISTVDNFYTFRQSKDFGTIKGSVKTNHPHFILQLINDKKQVVAEKENQRTYTFEWIPPGEYTLRALIDTNNNGAWEYGNILKMQPPEGVVYYESSITIRANWEIQDIDFEF